MKQMTIQYETVDRLTSDERLVWDTLSTSHRGRSEAITQASLSVAVGMPARRMRKVMKSLIQVHGLPVGSSPHQPAGYYTITNQAEAAEATARYYRQALSLLYRMRRLRDIALRELIDQLELDLKTYRD